MRLDGQWTVRLVLGGVLGGLGAGCFPEPADYVGPDDPYADHDNDGQTEAEGDCAPDDPFVFDGAAEFCDGRANGCTPDPGWTAEQERGLVTWIDPRGVPSDVTEAWSQGTEDSPAVIALDTAGTAMVCPGTQFVQVEIVADGVHLEGRTPDVEDPPILSGGNVVPVVSVATNGGLTTVSSLSIVDGAAQSGGFAGGLSLIDGELVVTDTDLSGHVGLAGGAVHIAGTAALERVRITDSLVYFPGGGGAGVHVAAGAQLRADALSIAQCGTYATDRDDPAAPRGGGLWNEGTATVRRSTFEEGLSILGGGVANDGQLTLTDSVVRDCDAADGGGIWTGPSSSTVLEGITVSGNVCALGGNGGGLYNGGTLSLEASDFVANWAQKLGGGVYNAAGAELTADQVLVASNYGFEGGNICDQGTSTWSNGAVLAGLAHAGGGLYAAEGGFTTFQDVAVWSNRIRMDDPDDPTDEGRGGGGVLLRGAEFVCTADAELDGPFLESGPVFSNNTSAVHPAGGLVLSDSPDYTDTVFRSEGCHFGDGSDANDGIPLFAAFSNEAYDVAGLETTIVCSREQCLCGDAGPCPPFVDSEAE